MLAREREAGESRKERSRDWKQWRGRTSWIEKNWVGGGGLSWRQELNGIELIEADLCVGGSIGLPEHRA